MIRKKGRYNPHDTYYHAAKKQGYLARSVFKLAEIDKQFHLIHKSSWVLDLGCSPGSFIQYAQEKLGPSGGMVGVDLEPLKLTFAPPIHFMCADIFEVSPEALSPKRFSEKYPPYFDVVLSDMAPHTCGIKSLDQDRSLLLCEKALEIATALLRVRGHFCVKILEGGGLKGFATACQNIFEKVQIKRPQGTRPGSMETYVVAQLKKA